MKRLAVLGVFALVTSGLFAQGLDNIGGQTKDQWEEINFEFNSTILSDGYPSLLRLADLLSQHRDYRVKLVGNTDSVGSETFNNRLSLRRAEAVKAFLVKYGASADQITTSADGKRTPEVPNGSKEGRFMNRRVVMTVTDGTGKVVGAGGVSDVLKQMQDFIQKQQECCDQILKRLDKLDDILAALKNLQGENDKLRSEIADLRNQHNALADQVAQMPKPVTAEQAQTIAHNEATGAAKQAQADAERHNQKFALLGLDAGPTYGGGRTGDYTASARARYFSPFGGDGQRAVQAQGEFLYYPDRKEGQFDIGLVNRWGAFQAGGFASFKFIDFKQYQQGGGLGQAAGMLDYVFRRGRVGGFITRGFKNYAVLNSVTLAPGAYLQTFARVVNQQGASFLVGTWGDAFVSGDLAYLQLRETHNSRPGANLKLTQPLNPHVALTAEARYNTSYVSPQGSGEMVFGVEMGNYIKPSDYAGTKTPVPMDVPRIRYEFGTRRVGSSPPIANAGPNQIGIPAGNVTLNGSGSYDPLAETLTYSWSQISGPNVALSATNQPVVTFTAAAGNTYMFRLTVTNTDHLSSSATTTVSTQSPSQAQITSFTATPATIQPGQSATLSWTIKNATTASISPSVGAVNAQTGSASVSPTSTTTYTLTATNANGTVTQSVTVSVGVGTAQIVRFAASPINIQPGQTSTLSWATNGANTVTITPGIGAVEANGSTTVKPTQTTTYTLTATSPDGHSVTSPVTVTVGPGSVPQVVTFAANPPTITAGQSSQLCWQVANATSISITGIGNGLAANACQTVSPATTTTYTLTATNASGQIQANATVNVGAVQIISFTSSPSFSISGQPVTLSWQTQNASSVVITGNGAPPQSLPANGTVVVAPDVTTTYTLTAYGVGGQTVSVSISAVVR